MAVYIWARPFTNRSVGVCPRQLVNGLVGWPTGEVSGWSGTYSLISSG